MGKCIGCGWLGGAALAALLVLPSAGCGKKAPPFVPVAASGTLLEYLVAVPARGGIRVAWKEVAERPKPTGGANYARYVLRRAVGDGEPEELTTVAASGKGGVTAEYLDTGVVAGDRCTYQLRLLTTDRKSVFTFPAIELTVGAGPVAPAKPAAEEGDGQVSLRWEAPPGGSPAGYNLFRAEEGKSLPAGRPLNPVPLTEPLYLDTAVGNGEAVCYAVTALVPGEAGVMAESAMSAESCAVPRDRTPPAPPTGLAATVSAGAVILTWESGREPDLAGYRVWRQTAGEGPFVSLTPQSQASPLFRDGNTVAGTSYRYAVTAVDRAAEPNESPFSAAIDIVLP